MSSLSTSLYGASTNKGVGGLLSGLDTDDLVKQMTAATRNKINRQYQAKQKLLYRQESYREVSKKLLAFSDKYFSYSTGSKTNILSSKFFEANTFKSPSNYVNVTGNADNIKNFTIDSITSVASAATYTSTVSASSQSIVSRESIKNNVSALVGGTMSLKFNNKTYNLKLDDEFIEDNKTLSIDNVVDQLNKQLATIEGNESLENLKYTYLDNKIKFETGKGTATLVAASTNITSILKMEISKPDEEKIAESTADIKAEDLVRTTDEVLSDPSNYITFQYNGVTKKIDLKAGLTDGASLQTHLQDKVDELYGAGKIDVQFVENKFSFKTVSTLPNDNNILKVSGISSELSKMINIKAGDSNRLNTTAAISNVEELKGLTSYSITVNGKPISFDGTMSVSDIIKKINNESDVEVTYSSITDKFVFNSKDTGKNSKIDISGELANKLFESNILATNGEDTVMKATIHGQSVDIVRSTANFTIDDINIELNQKAAGSVSVGAPITFDVTNNSDEVVERVKQFINDYNEIINLIGTKTSEKPNRSYLPLTPEQQDEMEEKEIENWTTEAKKGVLYGDSKMNNVLRNMRSAMAGFTDVSSLTLSDIGISSARMDTSGKLVFDEAKFKEQLLENPDEIANLFSLESTAGSETKSGIAIQLQALLKENIGNYGTTGLLVEEAGLAGNLTADKNYISEKIEEYDDKMAELKKALEAERKRYWNKFSALESSLNRLNAQSSWLTDSMGQ